MYDGIHDPSGLLSEPTPAQVLLLETMAEGFVQNGGRWPVFEFLEETLDSHGWDAAAELQTLPRQPQDGYSSVVWGRGGAKPPSEWRIPLTILGVHHAEVMNRVQTGLYPLYHEVLTILSTIRHAIPITPDAVRSLVADSDAIIGRLTKVPGYIDPEALPSLLWELLDHEPPTWRGGKTQWVDGWSRDIPREVRHFGNIGGVGDYLAVLLGMTAQPATVISPAAPTPLGLVAAIDYLDATWRLVPHKERLFRLHSAQRVAQLAFPAATAAEFDSRLSGLGEILRNLNVPQTTTAAAKRRRGTPLAPLESYLHQLVPEESQGRITQAVLGLSDVLAVRDAGQHSAAGATGAAALNRLGIGHPPGDWPGAWDRVMEVTIEAFEAIREELATLSP